MRDRGGRRYPDRVRAPYGFVPLSSEVVIPDWGDKVHHDVPFSDGWSGWFDLVIEAETPIFTRGSKKRESRKEVQKFFRLPNGICALPGSSIRGMLRNVVEIASFGRMSRVTDRRFGFRDLNNPHLYRNHMSDIVRGDPSPMVEAGWLTSTGDAKDPEEQAWRLEPCHFAKVEYGTLEDLARERGVRGFRPGKKQGAHEKYEAWGAASRVATLPVRVILAPGEVGKRTRVARLGAYGKVDLGRGAVGEGERGTLVFTGQPQEYDSRRMRSPKRKGAGNPKHHDFFFYGRAGEGFAVPGAIRDGFLSAHADTGQQHKLDIGNYNKEWQHHRAALERGGRVPVFFLRQRPKEGGGEPVLRAMGLAMMFRLTYEHSPREQAERHQEQGEWAPEGSEATGLDLAQLVFGEVRPDPSGTSGSPRTQALRGRVSIETAPADRQLHELEVVRAALTAPRATYYPSYVRQEGYREGKAGRDRQSSKPRYATWMDEDAVPRGWKRYQQREDADLTPPLPRDKQGNELLNVVTELKPLAAGARFRGRVHVHNLRTVELGALVWALDFGGLRLDEDSERLAPRHGFGMAKPLGFGGVRLSVPAGTVHLDRADGAEPPEDILASARAAYEDYMEQQLGYEWRGSEQLYELLALATPRKASEVDDLRAMSIRHPTFRNEFQQVKQAGLALPPASLPTTASSGSGVSIASSAMSLRDWQARWRAELGEQREARRAQKHKAHQARVQEAARRRASAEAERLAALDPGQRVREELEEARRKSQHMALFREWAADAGSADDDARRQAAMELLGKPSSKWRKKNKDIWVWLRGEQR